MIKSGDLIDWVFKDDNIPVRNITNWIHCTRPNIDALSMFEITVPSILLFKNENITCCLINNQVISYETVWAFRPMGRIIRANRLYEVECIKITT